MIPSGHNGQKIGSIIKEDGAIPKPHEEVTAEALARNGHNIRFVRSHTVIGMADVYLDGTVFELKAPEGKTINCIERNLRKAVDHQSGNVVIDSFRIKNIQDRSIGSFLIERLRRKHGLKRIIFVTKERKVIDINKLI